MLKDGFERRVRGLIEASIATKQALLDNDAILATIAKVSNTFIQALREGNKILLFGNGGSAADAQHIAAEFVGRFALERPALPALALSVNTSCVTAIGNDYGYEKVFARQVEALGRPGDVAFGISTSGNSLSVVAGIAVAKKIGIHTVGMTGRSGGKLKAAVEECISVPSAETPRIQECHILIGHIISEITEYELFHEKCRVPRSRRSN